MPIQLNKITDRQKLTIRKGLLDYCYIMDNWKINDGDFQDVYYNFYLKARWALFSKLINKSHYFDVLQNTNPNENLIDILESLNQRMTSNSYEFSIGSKLLHTVNPSFPIYDRKVREYLSKEEGIKFWWNTNYAPRRIGKLDKISHDWDTMIKWYRDVMNLDKGQEWIDWFDNNFPDYKNISNVKKIDFIIFATT